jgi:hypothetical protein
VNLHDDATPRREADGLEPVRVPPAAETPEFEDREVPLPQSAMADVIHRWLDGEPVAEGALADEVARKQVRFWSRVEDEAARRRRLTTPAHVIRTIMEQLPDGPAPVRDE